ncbi:hypothetical protein P6709_04330 [Jeotgalibacillus sp. ET6]|uniref:hypothetical protein n=1 Tax=Jeotgalibacillus sp. ET6 TaxID=3037260 RepID=UPI0024187155|nr:hypothetical protein [Jeotgalibacillus sp. ET6]MDG5470964.1 hypothetical protein [Jeotgalibacillus sp. ET6]
MASYIFAAIGMLLLIPVLYFIPIGFSVAGRLLLAGAALLSAFAAIALQPFLNTLQSVLIGAMLTITAAILLPRAAAGIFKEEEEDQDVFSFSEPIPAGPYAPKGYKDYDEVPEENTGIKESYETEELSKSELDWFLAPAPEAEKAEEEEEELNPAAGEDIVIEEPENKPDENSVLDEEIQDNAEEKIEYYDEPETEAEEEDEVASFLDTRNKIMLNDLQDEDDNTIEPAENPDEEMDESVFNRSWLEAAVSAETAAAYEKAEVEEDSLSLTAENNEELLHSFTFSIENKADESDQPQVAQAESINLEKEEEVITDWKDDLSSEKSEPDLTPDAELEQTMSEQHEENFDEVDTEPLAVVEAASEAQEVFSEEVIEPASEDTFAAKPQPAFIDPELFQTILDQFSYMQASLSASEYEESIRSVIELPLAQEQKLALYRHFLLFLIEKKEMNHAGQIAEEMADEFSMYRAVTEEIKMFREFIAHSHVNG